MDIYTTTDLPPLPREYIVDAHRESGLTMDWELATQICRPLHLRAGQSIKPVQTQNSLAKEVLAKCSAAQIDDALLSVKKGERKWLLGLLLDMDEA